MKLTKSARYSLIATLCAGGISASLQPTKYDLREEKALVAIDNGDLPQDADLPALPSRLNFEQVKEVREDIDGATLTAKERKQAKADLLAFRIQRDLSAPRNPFALAII